MASVLSLVRPRSAAGVELPRFLEPADAVALISDEATSKTTMYQELRQGAFPAIRLRYRWVVPSRAVFALERAAREFRPVERSDWDDGWDEAGDGPRFFWLPSAARLLTVHPATLARLIKENRFPATKIRSKWVVPTAAIDAMERAALEGWTFVTPDAFTITPGQRPAWATPVAVNA